MFDAEEELQARQFEKLLLMRDDFGDGTLALGRLAGGQKILKAIPVNFGDAVTRYRCPAAAPHDIVERVRSGRMHLNIFADAADLCVAAHQRSMLFEPKAQKLFAAEARKPAQKDYGLDHGFDL